MKPSQKDAKATELLAFIDDLFHRAEQASPLKQVTYLDILRIAECVRLEFNDDPLFIPGVPPEIDGALDVACGLCNPNRREGIERIKKGLGLLISLAGGYTLFWGILYVIANGIILTTVTGVLWWKTSVVTMVIGGPIGIGAGFASFIIGLYFIAHHTSTKQQAFTAFEVMREAIKRWARHKPKSFVSVLLTVMNHTRFRFVRADFRRSSGTYTVQPPHYIESGDASTFCIESCGFMTGAIGAVTYKIEHNGGICHFDFSAPFIGANSYGHRSPNGFIVERDGGSGYSAQVTYRVLQG